MRAIAARKSGVVGFLAGSWLRNGSFITIIAPDFILGAGDFSFEFLASLFKFTHALAHATGEFWEFFRSEQKKDHDEDHDHLRTTDRA